MPDGYTDVQLNDGTTLRFNGENLDPLTVKTKVAAYRAGVGTTAPVPKVDMGPETLPQKIAKLTPDQKQRAEAGSSMALPEMLLSLGMLGPVGLIEREGLGGGLAKIGANLGRGALKSAAGAAAGAGVGAGVGEIAGDPKSGARIGAGLGAATGAFLPDSVYSRAPYGLNRLILGEEGLAEARTASKLAQRDADIRAGLRKPLGAARGGVGGGLTPGGVPTSLYGGPVDVPPASGAGSLTSTGPSVSLSPANMPPALSTEGVEGTLPAGRNRLIKTPEEFASADQRYKISKQLAHERGMNFAAGEVPASGRKVPRISPMSTTQEEAPMVNMEQLQRAMSDPATTHGAPDTMSSTLEGTGWKVRSRYPDMNMTEIGNPNHNYTITVRDSDLANPDAVRGRIRVKDAQAAQEMQ